MRSILFLFSFCLFVPLQIDGTGQSTSQLSSLIRRATEKHGEHVTMTLAMAKSGKSIHGVLKLLENGLVGTGSAGFVFRGLRLKDKKPVAIKFISQNKIAKAKREYETYSYLSAINMTQVEKYGIPTVYYYGQWENLTLTAYTELDETLQDRSQITELQTYDYLFLIQHFIRQSKYIHSKGIRHDDIKPENILLRDCEAYLNDFDCASKMKEDNGYRTAIIASLRQHKKERRLAIDDWESFLYTLSYLLSIPLDWFRNSMTNAVKNDKKASFKLYGELKSNRTKILAIIDQKHINFRLKKVLLLFAEEVFSDKKIPDYDGFDKLVADTLAQYYPDKTCFSWITENLNRKKYKESIKRANTKIGDLMIPNDIYEYENFAYPDVDEEFFNKQSNRFFGCTKNPCVK